MLEGRCAVCLLSAVFCLPPCLVPTVYHLASYLLPTAYCLPVVYRCPQTKQEHTYLPTYLYVTTIRWEAARVRPVAEGPVPAGDARVGLAG